MVNESIIIHLETEKKYYQDVLIFRVEFHSSINGGKNGGNLKKNGVINLFIVNQLIIIHLETEKKYYQDILIFRIEFHSSIN